MPVRETDDMTEDTACRQCNILMIGVSDSAADHSASTPVPLPNIRGACSKNGQPDGCIISIMHGRVELQVFSILVVLYPVVHEDICHWDAVNGEQQRSRY